MSLEMMIEKLKARQAQALAAGEVRVRSRREGAKLPARGRVAAFLGTQQRRGALLALVALALGAQVPGPAPVFDEAFFSGDRRAVLEGCADKARSIKPKDAKYLAECGRAYLAAMDKPKAIEAFKEAEAREAKDGPVLRLIAQAWLKQGYKTEALEGYEKILQRDPRNKEALTLAAVDLAEVGLVKEAERYMEALVALDRNGWERFLLFGRALLVAGQRKKAAVWFARATALKPGEEKVFLEISRAFAETQSVM
jgi:tetratricopeptide (TPR) repeat protein